MGNWMGWNGPIFNPVSGAGAGNDGGNKRVDQYTETLIAIEPGDAPGLYHALVQVRARAGFDYIEVPQVKSLRNKDLRSILAFGDNITAEVGAVAERTVRSRYGREKHFTVDRDARSDRGGTVSGGYTSGGEPDPGAQNW